MSKRILVKVLGEWQEWEVEDFVILADQRKILKLTVNHPSQEAILVLSHSEDISKLSLREIGLKTGVGDHPQKIKHHLDALVKKGLLEKTRKGYKALSEGNNKGGEHA